MSVLFAAGLSRRQRRTAAKRYAQQHRGEVIAMALIYLASAGPTATGCIMLFPDGRSAYLGIDDARQHVASTLQGPRH